MLKYFIFISLIGYSVYVFSEATDDNYNQSTWGPYPAQNNSLQSHLSNTQKNKKNEADLTQPENNISNTEKNKSNNTVKKNIE